MANLAAKRKKRKVEGGANITDGCNPELVVGARFDGTLGIPVIEKPVKIKVPAGMVPFSKMGRVEDPRRFAVCEYELDVDFADLLHAPEDHVKALKRYQAFVSPDASMYWDAPLAAQIINKYRNHTIGYYMQSRGVYTIPNVRWGDERTYTTDYLPEPLAFLGVEKHSIVSIGSYGVVKSADEKRHFRAGLEAMLEWLEPEVVLVYGSTPDDVFGDYWQYSEFVRYPDWTSYVRRQEGQAQPEDAIRKPGRKG